MNAVIYARYSSDSQREESIEGQLRECREYAERKDVTVVGTYIDRALSAKTADRPEFQHMIEDSAKELFEIVLVWKLDRFSRDRYDSAHYKHILKKNGVKVVSAKEHISEGPEGLFNRVQERMEKNRHAPAMAKAKEDYLLTTKLFCGKCERMMVGESGKSHTGAMHYYYKCSGAKRLKDCDKKAVRKDWIERVVVRLTMQRVMDEEKINRLIDAILVMQEQEDTTTPALRSQLAETESSIGNILKAIEQGIFTPSTKQRLDELEARKEEILVNIQTAELQKPKLTREQMTAWFEQFRHGDPANREFQKRLIDTFVNAVYVFDDKLVLTYNYQHGTQTISLEEIESALSSDFDGATPPIKASNKSLNHAVCWRLLLCHLLGLTLLCPLLVY